MFGISGLAIDASWVARIMMKLFMPIFRRRRQGEVGEIWRRPPFEPNRNDAYEVEQEETQYIYIYMPKSVWIRPLAERLLVIL